MSMCTSVHYEVGACMYARPVKHLCRHACTSLSVMCLFIHMGFFVWTDVWKPTNQTLSCAIIAVILIKVLHCDPLIFSQR